MRRVYTRRLLQSPARNRLDLLRSQIQIRDCIRTFVSIYRVLSRAFSRSLPARQRFFLPSVRESPGRESTTSRRSFVDPRLARALCEASRGRRESGSRASSYTPRVAYPAVLRREDPPRQSLSHVRADRAPRPPPRPTQNRSGSFWILTFSPMRHG